MTALDVAALDRALRVVAGRRFLGPVDGGDCVELVFEADPRGNLVTIFHTGRRAGSVAFGGVASPEEYVERCGESW